MEMRTLGRTGLSVSALGLGGAEIGEQSPAFEAVVALLNTALDEGLNVIDTAECYGVGEELIGKVLSPRRKEFNLFTKTGHASGIDLPDWDKRLIAAQIDRSLQRLKTDRVELLQLHSCGLEILRQGDVIAALQKIREAGKARFLGYSGDGQAARYAIESGAFDALQTSVSIADQEAIDLTLPLAQARQMGVIVKRPIANAAWRYAERPDNAYHQPYWERLRVLDYDFLRSDPREAASVALRFTLGVPGVHTMIVGTSKPGRWRENAALLDAGPLPRAQFEAIRSRWREVADASWVGQT
jgi:aryl-alcohol dehydrogenase-like predicted oxidoreductase